MNLNKAPKYGGSSSTRLTFNTCRQNVWLYQQTNPHGHIVYIVANSNISYCINVMLNLHGKKFCPSICLLWKSFFQLYKTYGQYLSPKCVVTSTNKPTWPHCLYSSKFQYHLLHQCNVECAWEKILSQYVFYEIVFSSMRKTSRIQTLARKSRFLFVLVFDTLKFINVL